MHDAARAGGIGLEFGNVEDHVVIGAIVALLLAALANEVPPVAARGDAVPRGDPFTLWRDASLRRRMTLPCCICFGAFGTLAGVVVWMPTILVQSGFRPGQGGAILSWNAVGALVSMTSAGFMLERFGARALTVGFAAATLLMVGLGMALGSLAACMALLGVALGMAASGGIAATGQSLPAALQSSALGWAMGVGRLGQVALPLLMGLALQRGWVLAPCCRWPVRWPHCSCREPLQTGPTCWHER